MTTRRSATPSSSRHASAVTEQTVEARTHAATQAACTSMSGARKPESGRRWFGAHGSSSSRVYERGPLQYPKSEE